jgi:hypothetical protein
MRSIIRVETNANNYLPNAEDSVVRGLHTRCSSIQKIPLLPKKDKDSL